MFVFGYIQWTVFIRFIFTDNGPTKSTVHETWSGSVRLKENHGTMASMYEVRIVPARGQIP